METPVKKDQIIDICPDSVNEAGDGVARIQGGFVVFCKDLLPGERGKAKVIKVSANYAVARVISRENDSGLRREVTCPYYSKGCGGCAYLHVTEEGQLSLAAQRVADCIERIGGFRADNGSSDAGGLRAGNDPSDAIGADAARYPGVLPCISPADNHFRNKTAYPFFEIDRRIRTGFYARASHRPVPFEPGKHCPHENPLAALIREKLEAFASEHGITAYDETTGRGILRHLTVRISDRMGLAMAVITANTRKLPFESELTATLSAAVPKLASLWLCSSTGAGNAVLGGPLRLLFGRTELECVLGTTRFLISPDSFFQVSTAGAELLYDTVYRFAGLLPEEQVLDLYCGAGTIGLYLIDRFRKDHPDAALPKLTGVEIVDSAVDNARRNAVLNGIGEAGFICGNVPEVIGRIDPGKLGIVIIDPPRKGTDEVLIASLRALSPSRIIYVSCNPATLARDLRSICADGFYRIEAVQPVNMFPDTGHVECVTLLQRMSNTRERTITLDVEMEDYHRIKNEGR
ncbi:MAG: 23S rRNA (uracil(1939)-C(5))-methyltransferase RlmD [Clostridia bacterium]|nr:23S rRNA (uracil(1939)-C(5))-methyltransferase RlmD [Clostridia bacterium]